jgi:uncharacterized protein (TIGR03437 family)
MKSSLALQQGTTPWLDSNTVADGVAITSGVACERIGGAGAAVSYAGPAPDAVKGLFQGNAVVPDSIAPGAAVEIVVTVGGTRSQKSVMFAAM